ncbi:hypothetical protein ND748_31275, partial [Frankia sp. AiPs1]|nr:hypothetical protein [Frankia sp. AiPs1]
GITCVAADAAAGPVGWMVAPAAAPEPGGRAERPVARGTRTTIQAPSVTAAASAMGSHDLNSP